jgi:hypothetical protein
MKRGVARPESWLIDGGDNIESLAAFRCKRKETRREPMAFIA